MEEKKKRSLHTSYCSACEIKSESEMKSKSEMKSESEMKNESEVDLTWNGN